MIALIPHTHIYIALIPHTHIYIALIPHITHTSHPVMPSCLFHGNMKGAKVAINPTQEKKEAQVFFFIICHLPIVHNLSHTVATDVRKELNKKKKKKKKKRLSRHLHLRLKIGLHVCLFPLSAFCPTASFLLSFPFLDPTELNIFHVCEKVDPLCSHPLCPFHEHIIRITIITIISPSSQLAHDVLCAQFWGGFYFLCSFLEAFYFLFDVHLQLMHSRVIMTSSHFAVHSSLPLHYFLLRTRLPPTLLQSSFVYFVCVSAQYRTLCG
ncbi:MAG: hypothetical protein BYD32DRAFT_155623 [Podila humilis]|nr:MAG: hypothetical protein BYD32DRAFT_155623 [Podila humilis]